MLARHVRTGHLGTRHPLSGTVTLAALVLAVPVAIVWPWWGLAIAIVMVIVMPATILNAATANAARHGFGSIPIDRLALIDALTLDRQRTRVDAVGDARLRSIGVAIVDDAAVGIFGYCGTILRIDGEMRPLAGGATALARAIETARRTRRLASLVRATTVASSIVTVALVALDTALAIAPTIGAIVMTGVVLAWVVDDRRYEDRGMTRLERRVTRRFEAMFRGI